MKPIWPPRRNIADTLGIATVEQATGIADPIVVVYIAAQ